MDKFIQTHGKRLFGLCMHLCRNRDEAEELHQETWLKALRSFGQYDPGLRRLRHSEGADYR